MALNIKRILKLSEELENDPDCPPMTAEQAEIHTRLFAPREPLQGRNA